MVWGLACRTFSRKVDSSSLVLWFTLHLSTLHCLSRPSRINGYRRLLISNKMLGCNLRRITL